MSIRAPLLALGLAAVLVLSACARPPDPASCADASGASFDPNATAPNASRPPIAPATALGLYGKVYEGCEGKPVADVCITIGVPGAICWARTDADGNYRIDLDGIVDPDANSFFSLTFIKAGYVTDTSKSFEFRTTRIQRVDHRMHR